MRKTISIILLTITLIFFPLFLYAKTFTDDTGRNIDINEIPSRIISLAPSITEILFYLNLGDRVVGVTDFCNFPVEANSKPRVGWLISPDVEKIISLKPELVFATAEGNRPDVVDTLERVNIRVYVLNPHSIADIMQEIISIGKITGKEEIAIQKVGKMKVYIELIKKKIEGSERIRVLYLVSVDPLISVGPGSFIHDAIEAAGGENVMSKSPTRYPKLGVEEIVARDPEVILIPPELLESVRDWKDRWSGISAVKHNRIYTIDTDIINRPGPRIVEGLEQIYRYIH